MTDQPAAPKRPKSQKRVRNRGAQIRFTDQEYEEAHENARRVGLSLGAFGRGLILGRDPGPDVRRRASVEKELLLRLLAETGQLRHDADEIAYKLKQGNYPEAAALNVLARNYDRVRHSILMALVQRRDLYLSPDYAPVQPSQTKKGTSNG